MNRCEDDNCGPFWRSGYNYDREAASDESGLRCEDPSLTVQSMSKEADINVIMRQYAITGELPVTNRRVLQNQDFDEVMDFRTAMDLVREGQESFMALPPEVRSRFQNDPRQFVDFCSDEANLPELVKLGLAVAPVEGAAVPEPSVPVPSTEGKPSS